MDTRHINDKIILITTLKNARNLLNSVSCEVAAFDNMHESISDIVTKLANLERKLINNTEKSGENKIVKCPYCDKEGGISNMKRWHFDNCKMRNGENNCNKTR